MFKPNLVPAPSIKPMVNVGATFDIPNGVYIIGTKGESILNGGAGMITGVVGIGNNFKSTIVNYMMLTMTGRLNMKFITTYDTEVNIHQHQLVHISQGIRELRGRNLIDEGTWVITDKSTRDEKGQQMYANIWYDIMKEYWKSKTKNGASMSRKTPFFNRDRTGNFEIIEPTATAVDSFTEFETEDVVKMSDDNQLGDSGANTIFMRQGASKTRFVMELPALLNAAHNYTFLTAQLGKEIPMDPRAAPNKKLQFLKNNDKIKGVTDKFTFLTSDCYHCYNAAPMMNQATKAPEYPIGEALEGDTDLFMVTVRNLRSKSGKTGMTLEIIVSQRDGVLPTLTEFHYIKTNNRFGIGGNDRNYFLELLPEVKLSRTVIRQKIDNDHKLRRAMNITSEMCQIFNYHRPDQKYYCTPAQLYQELKDKGYDWDLILEKTRGWWTLVGEHEDTFFLSTMDLLRMRVGDYIPYWYPEKDKIKP